MNKPWLQYYPEGVPAEVPELPFASLVDLLEDSFKRFADRPVFKFMGRSITYREMDVASRNFAAYLQAKGLKRGDRVALMMPNVLQYPVAVAGVLRAGMVVVNTNPLYTPRELKHQLTDSGARAIVILENMATTLQKCLPDVPVEHVIVASVGDMLPMLKGTIVNFVLRRVKKMVPAYELPGAERWNHAIRTGAASTFERVTPAADDMASLQYTGGTTGVSKGCILSHRNLVSNVIQSELWHEPAMRNVPAGEQTNTICALPLYHIFGFTVNMMLSMRQGGCNILIINPRDIPAVIKELKAQPFHLFPAVNTLFGAIARHPDAKSIDWSSLRISVGGGMAVQGATADLWKQVTGCTICQGYGLSETAPVACCNIVTETQYTGTIGYPVVHRLPYRGRRWQPTAGRRAWRTGHQGPTGHGGLLEPAGRYEEVLHQGRLLPDGRYRRHGRDGRHQDRRPQEGHDQRVRLQRLSERGRRRGHPHAGHCGGGRHRHGG